MDIRSLKHAIALAEAGSFVRAADRLALSQSAVSRSILALEEGLGVVLFDRTPSGVHPTAAGRTLVASARRIVAEAEALRSEVALAQGEIAGDLIFGAVPALAVGYLPQIIAEGMRANPQLTYRQILHLQQAAKLRVQLVCDSLHVLQRVAIHSDTLLISSRMSMAGLIADGQLVELSLADGHSYEPGEIEIVSLKGRSLSPAAQLRVNQLVDFLAGQNQG